MDNEKRKKLEAAGWKVGDADEFLGLETFVVAVKRECRNSAPKDWQEQIEKLEGIKIVENNGLRIRVQGPKGFGPADVHYKLSEAVGQYCHIEPVILHT